MNDQDTKIWEDRAEHIAHSATVHPGRFIAKIVGAVIALSLLTGVVGFATHWFGTAAHVISPENVKQVYAVTFSDYEALQAAAANACQVRAAEVGLTGDALIQRQSQVLAIVSNYNRVKADYDATMANIFEAKKVKPAELPLVAPSETEMEGSVC